MGKALAIARLTRIEHGLMLIVAVLAGEAIAKGIPPLGTLALSLITAVFISMSAFAINDYYDVESDRMNKRSERPLVSGELKMEEALWVSIVAALVGIAASAFINYYALIIALIFAGLSFLYSYKLKDLPLLGNIYIGFSMAIPLIFGDYVVSQSLSVNVILISLIIFLSGLARELHGTIRDYSGDQKARQSKNIVHHIGAQRSAQYAFVFYIEAVGLSIFMFFFRAPFYHNIIYLIPILFVDALLLYVAYTHLVDYKSERLFRSSRNISLGAMALALLIYLAVALA